MTPPGVGIAVWAGKCKNFARNKSRHKPPVLPLRGKFFPSAAILWKRLVYRCKNPYDLLQVKAKIRERRFVL
jgi:hypothetical protein